MILQIEIECETIFELLQHLHELKLQVQSKARQEGYKSESDFFRDDDHLDDNNCYGCHTVVLISS